MAERESHPAVTHLAFPYYFSETSIYEDNLTFPYSFPFSFGPVSYSEFPLIFPFPFETVNMEAQPDNGIFLRETEIIVIITPRVSYKYRYDLAIFYGDLQNTYVEGRCSRWDAQDYNIIIGTWIKKSDLQNIKDNIRPGAVKELKRVIDTPKFYDSSWQGYNTLRFLPTPSSSEMSHSNLKNMRRSTVAYVRNITEHPIPNSDWVELKLECAISGSQL